MGNSQLVHQRQEEGTAENAQGAGRGLFATILRIIFQIFVMHFVFNFFGKNSNVQNKVDSNGNVIPPLINYLEPNTPFDVYVHLSKKNWIDWSELNRTAELIWFSSNEKYVYEQFSSSKYFNFSLKIEEDIINNKESLYLITSVIPHRSYAASHVAAEEKKMNSDLSSDEENKAKSVEKSTLKKNIYDSVSKDIHIISSSVNIIDFIKPFTLPDLISLVGVNEGEDEKTKIDKPDSKERHKNLNDADSLVAHLKTRHDIGLVFDTSNHLPNSLLQEPLKSSVRIFPLEGFYHPVLESSDFWMIENDFIPLNETLVNKNVTLRLSFSVVSVWSWMIKKQLKQSFENQTKFGFYSTKESFMFKKILLNTNIYMLIFSAVFMILHSIFSFFAFKNDIQFWYNNDSMQGLSALSVVFSLVCELIVALYLYDSENTSWIILFEIFVGVVLSAWKVTKAVKLKISSSFPFVKFSDAKNYKESNTKKYDTIAIKYMSIVLMPCVAGYAIYSLYYNKYKSWYSYIISVLAGTVYTFGFIMMTPQLYINYKLKSVEHLPWRALIYRSMNTFVDDIASFLIDIPLLHRLSCFRDDIIFILYLYQRWIYRVDKTRHLGGQIEEKKMEGKKMEEKKMEGKKMEEKKMEEKKMEGKKIEEKKMEEKKMELTTTLIEDSSTKENEIRRRFPIKKQEREEGKE